MSSELPYISIQNVSKTFNTPKGPLTILDDVELHIQRGEKVAILGPSGSGKTTILSLLAGLDRPTTGSIVVGEKEISSLEESELSAYRNKTVGIIFQSFELVLPFTVLENVQAPLDIAGTKNDGRVQSFIEQVSLVDRKDAFPQTLSGGEQQRVAIARALVHDPELILADEPTGSLDRETGAIIFDLLLQELEKEHKTFVVITHDEKIAERMDRIFTIQDQRLHEEL